MQAALSGRLQRLGSCGRRGHGESTFDLSFWFVLPRAYNPRFVCLPPRKVRGVEMILSLSALVSNKTELCGLQVLWSVVLSVWSYQNSVVYGFPEPRCLTFYYTRTKWSADSLRHVQPIPTCAWPISSKSQHPKKKNHLCRVQSARVETHVIKAKSASTLAPAGEPACLELAAGGAALSGRVGLAALHLRGAQGVAGAVLSEGERVVPVHVAAVVKKRG